MPRGIGHRRGAPGSAQGIELWETQTARPAQESSQMLADNPNNPLTAAVDALAIWLDRYAKVGPNTGSGNSRPIATFWCRVLAEHKVTPFELTPAQVALGDAASAAHPHRPRSATLLNLLAGRTLRLAGLLPAVALAKQAAAESTGSRTWRQPGELRRLYRHRLGSVEAGARGAVAPTLQHALPAAGARAGCPLPPVSLGCGPCASVPSVLAHLRRCRRRQGIWPSATAG